MGVKGWWQRPGEGYDNGHELIFGKRERAQYVPPPLPGAPASKDDAAEGDEEGEKR